MDRATAEDWGDMRTELRGYRATMPERIRHMLLGLRAFEAGGAFAVDQLTHALQTASYADRAGANEETVLAALLHDIGKVASPDNHGPIAAEILRPVVSEDTRWIVEVHQHFQGRFFYEHLGHDPETYRRYESHPAFARACAFSDWDQAAFDPDYETLPLGHFMPLVEAFWRKLG
jgi:predicted HD phosphohydrolase